MSRRTQLSPLLSFLTAAATSVIACGAQSTSSNASTPSTGGLYVDSVLKPPAPTGSDCFYTSDPTALKLSQGLVDGALAPTYAPTLLVGNQGTARIAIEGAHVKLVDPADGSTLENVTALAAGTVEAWQGVSSYTTLKLAILDSGAVHHFLPAVGQPPKAAVVHIQVYGTSATGEAVESSDFQFPVDVCNGCLVSIPATGGSSAPYCSGALPQVGSALACVMGQDQPVDCQKCYSTSAACHGT